jgi:type VI secretion system protein ImpJ
MKSDPLKLPPYNHEDLTGCFESLDEHIRQHLELLIPTNAQAIELTQVDECFYSGVITDKRSVNRSKWIFGVDCSIGEAAVISRTPKLVKVCSNQFIRKLVQRSIEGLELTHLPQPPAAISPRPEFQYFSVNQAGPCWDHIVETQQVGIYVPGELTNARLELVAIIGDYDQ